MSSPSPIILRPSVEQANIPALRDAYSTMQAISATDNRSWVYWAEYHGFNDNYCWHHARTGPGNTLYPYDLFLPWHRAYLQHWDLVTRDRNPDAILPWWDWTSELSHQVGLPQTYSEDPVDGQRNPLASGPTPDMPDDPARRTQRFPGDPSELPSQTQDVRAAQGAPGRLSIEHLLALTSFTDFSNHLLDVHDFVHGWAGGSSPNDPNLGGDMGVVATAAFDPIFWAHHCMIDRVWYLWQQRQGVNNIPINYLDLVLAPFGVTVRQVLDVHQLGYDYAGSSASGTPIASATGTGAAPAPPAEPAPGGGA